MISETPISDSTPHNVADLGMLCRRLERKLNAANKRISYLEEAVQDAIDACERDIGILQQRMSNLKTAKEAKP